MNLIKVAIIGSITLFLLFIFLIYLGVVPGLKFQFRDVKPADLEIWGVFDDSEAIMPLIEAFKKRNPQVNIVYRKKSLQDYEDELIRSFAVGKGPDIFMLHNTWVTKYRDLLSYAPSKIIGKDDFSNRFVDVVTKDFTYKGYVYGVPLYVDTLALYYNIDLFNSAGLIDPPDNWDDFKKYSRLLTRKIETGDILVSGAAMGSGSNVINSQDILSLLMIQNGSRMSDEEGRVIFDVERSGGAVKALEYYSDFAKKDSGAYSWSGDFVSDSQDMFSQGRVAMMLGYSYTKNIILRKSPRLRFNVSYVPQLKDAVLKKNYANYWGYGVYVKTPDRDVAWSFLDFISEPKNASFYLSVVKFPASQKAILKTQKNNPELSIFADQALTADSWLQLDNALVREVFVDMMDRQILGDQSYLVSLKKAASEINSKILFK